MEPFAHGSAPRSSRPTLQPLEWRVLELLADGLSSREVATQLRVSDEAVRDSLDAIFTKFCVGSKLEALIVAFRSGLIRPPST
jgi:DNA-binding NarL/FixJ family response regulator